MKHAGPKSAVSKSGSMPSSMQSSRSKYVLIACVVFVVIALIVAYNMYYETSVGKVSPENAYVNETKAYVISLDNEVFERAKNKLSSVGFTNIQKFDAIKGSSLQEFVKKRENVTTRALRSLYSPYRDAHADLGSINGVGCYLSHKALWQKVVDENLEGMWIFESDCVCISPLNKKHFDEFMAQDDPHMFLLGAALLQPSSSLQYNKINRIKSRFYLLHAYYITQNGARRMLEFASPIEQQVDSYISDLIQLGDIPDSGYRPFNAYALTPALCVQVNRKSSIQTKRVVG